MKIEKQGGAGEGQVPVSPLVFRLDSHSGVPTYLQLVQQVEHALRLGYLRRGDQLPRVKDVVASLAINPNTVLKAYRDLEYKGITGGRPGQGTFVRAAPRTVDVEELAALRASLVSGWLAEAAAAGLDDEGITALFLSVLRDFGERRGARARPRSGRRERPGRGEVVA
jgi:GntR family transcriptional regulator